jgi:hypothetical protein
MTPRHALAGRAVLSFLLLITSLLALPGCGGGGKQPTSTTTGQSRGTATVTVRWPEPSDSRLIPSAAASIQIMLTEVGDDRVVYGERTLVRPATPPWVTTTTFTEMPVKTINATAVAYPFSSATGVPQARVRVPVTILPDGDTPLRLTMVTTIERLEVSPASLTIRVAQPVPLVVTARDAAGDVVIVRGTYTFASDDANVATVNAAGVVTGRNTGTTRVRVTETESGKTAEVPCTVQLSADSVAPAYEVTEIVLPSGERPDFPIRLNNQTQIAGMTSRTDESGQVVRQPFFWQGGTFQRPTPLPGFQQAQVRDLNDAGDVIGSSEDAQGQIHPTLFRAGVPYDLLPAAPGQVQGNMIALTNAGTGVGFFGDAADNITVRLWEAAPSLPGRTRASNIPEMSSIGGANARGQVCYTHNPGGGDRPYILDVNTGATRTLAPPGAEQTVHINDINERGDMIGSGYAGISTNTRALFWPDGSTSGVYLPAPENGVFRSAFGVNDYGLIVGISRVTGVSGNRGTASGLNGTHDLNTRLVPGSGFVIGTALAVNNRGEIVAIATREGTTTPTKLVLLRPR